MAKPPAFQWYPKDCDTDENVRGMDDREFGFYMRCLNHAWLNNGLPGDLGELARIMGRAKNYVDKIWVRVGRCFELVDGRFINVTQETQRGSVREFIESKRSAAKTRWSASKKECTSNAHAYADASPVQCSASASPSASALETPSSPNCGEGAGDPPTGLFAVETQKSTATTYGKSWFDGQHDRWYQGFWNHKSKADSRRAFEKRVRLLAAEKHLSLEAAVEFLINQVTLDQSRFRFTSDWDWRARMHPATWLNGTRWEDEANKDPPASPQTAKTSRTKEIIDSL